jgi:hypothetical protein
MMTNGPEAHVGDILSVTLPRPRIRSEIMRHADYYRLREHLIGFLEGQEERHQADVVTNAVTSISTQTNEQALPSSAAATDSACRAEPLLAAG